jgi:tight adherence protein C
MTGMSASASGAAIGLLGGVGLWLVVWTLASRRVRLADRIAPYLRIRSSSSGLLRETPARTPFPTLERLISPVMADALRLVERLGSPTATVRMRLERAGRGTSVEQFRAEQVVWGVLGLGASLTLALTLIASRGANAASLTVFVLAAGLAGVLLRDQALSRQIARREERISAEFPTVAELLALSVGAGEGAVGALERVVRSTGGELSGELERTLSDARSGMSLTMALERLADRASLSAVRRFADGVAVAVDRGTPLADVLRAQAQDVRDARQRALMEAGGRKEVLMMVPVVFLILPVTVAFAVFPGLAVLRVGL